MSTVLISPVGTPEQNGTALLNALNGITDNSAAKPYLVKIEAGIYSIGTNSLRMKSYVDVEGSGENVTQITGKIDSASSGVVNGADNAELRFITVKNTGGGSWTVAIYNGIASPKITLVTAIASGGSNTNCAVSNHNSSATMTNVTAMASGGNFITCAVWNQDGNSYGAK